MQALHDAFFNEDYDFLHVRDVLPGFYVLLGDWKIYPDEPTPALEQNGKAWSDALSSGVAGIMTKTIGSRYQRFLDNIGAYFYFPLAIAKNSYGQDGVFSVKALVFSGKIDAAAGLAFGVKNSGNYFVWRVNALEDNAILFEFVNNRRIQHAEVSLPVKQDLWYHLEVRIQRTRLDTYLDGARLVSHEASSAIEGHLALWSKADSRAFQL